MNKSVIRTDRAAVCGIIGLLIVASELVIQNAVWEKYRLITAFMAVGLSVYFALKDRKIENERSTIILGGIMLTIILVSVGYMVFKFNLE